MMSLRVFIVGGSLWPAAASDADSIGRALSHSIAAAAPIHEGSASTPSEVELLALYPLAMLAATVAGVALVLALRWHRLPAAPRGETRTVAVPFLLFFIMLFVEGLGVQLAAAVSGFDLRNMDELPSSEAVRVTTILKAAGYVAALPLLIAAIWWQMQLRRSGMRSPAPLPQSLLLGGATFLLAWPMVVMAGYVGAYVEQLATGAAPDVIAHSTLEDLVAPDAGRLRWPLIVLVVVGAAVFEEALYRGLLQESVKRIARHRWIAIAVASVIFTGMHIGAVAPGALPALFLLSVWLGWAYEKNDSLLPPILAHMAFNALNIALALLTSPAPQ
jgi:membrane protease YdiL (CAAX protease family)